MEKKTAVQVAMGVCFWCGEEDGSVLVGSRLVPKAVADRTPRTMVATYEPCRKCNEMMERGVTLIEVVEHEVSDQRPELSAGVWPTGRWIVITEGAAKRAFPGQTGERVAQQKKALVALGVLERLGLGDIGMKKEALN